MELCDLPAYQISQMVHQRAVSAAEVVESTLKRISEVDGRSGSLDSGDIQLEDLQKVHAFITLNAERARDRAREIDQMLAKGEDPGSLAGVPYTVKDIFCVRNTPQPPPRVS